MELAGRGRGQGPAKIAVNRSSRPFVSSNLGRHDTRTGSVSLQLQVTANAVLRGCLSPLVDMLPDSTASEGKSTLSQDMNIPRASNA